MRCAVLNCNSAKTASDKNSQLCFFKFPKNADLAKQWLSFCGNEDALNMKNASVCMKHFKDDDIVGALKFELGLAKKRTLRQGAVPCLHLESESMSERARKERNQKRENQKLVAELLADAEMEPDDIEPTPSFVRYDTGIASAPAFLTPPKIENNSFVDEDDPLSGDAKQAYLKTQFIKCRTCYRDFELDASCEDPFDKANSVLLFRIEVICGVWLTSIEGGPRYMCPDCQSALNTAIEFREKVISTEVKLTQGNPVCDIAAVEVEVDSAENYQATEQATIEWPIAGMICKEEDDEANDVKASQSADLSTNIEMLEPLEEDIGADPSDPLSVARGTDILKELVIELIGQDKVTPEKPARKSRAYGEEEEEETIEDSEQNYMEDVIEEESEEGNKLDKKQTKEKKAKSQPKRKVNAKLKRERERQRLAKMREKPPNYVCDQCGAAFHLVHNLQIHMLRHTRTKNYQCTECPMKFYDAYMRNIHIRVRHKGELPFACRHCPDAFTNAGARHTHECKLHGVKSSQSSTKNTPKERQQPQRFFCETCDKSYVSKYALAWHVKSHAEANAFKCKLCDKSYNAPAMLKQHERVHKERPLQCDVCLKGFYQRTKLKAHKLIHSGERPHRCELCNVHFRYKTNLKTHENTKMHQENLRKVHESVTVDIE
ncbi:zinc finger protein 155 isoform X1 [Drosophila guanche]|uniref:zinc finger protein 155 isoform X1 n=1 Tax=Drosophila guanche TaxID=7266 RepID=UPI00147269D9|nr:zinc finger protein 155 isoform X1 [Drosophila guanche]